MARQHKFDFKKLGKDIGVAGIAATPSIGFGLTAYFNKWFAYNRECVNREWVQTEGWGSYSQCTEYIAQHSIGETLFIAIAAIAAGLIFWMVVAGLLSLGSAFLDRYLTCEEKSSEDDKEKDGDSGE